MLRELSWRGVHLGYLSHFLHGVGGRLRPGEEQQPPKVIHPVTGSPISWPFERAGLGVVPGLGGHLLLSPTYQPKLSWRL